HFPYPTPHHFPHQPKLHNCEEIIMGTHTLSENMDKNTNDILYKKISTKNSAPGGAGRRRNSIQECVDEFRRRYGKENVDKSSTRLYLEHGDKAATKLYSRTRTRTP